MQLKDQSLFQEQCYVNGIWVGDSVSEVTNPATGEVLGRVPNLGAAETRFAIEQADAAFKPWAKMLAKERTAILRKWHDLIVENADDLAMIMTLEQGKSLVEAKGEVLYGAGFVEFYADEARRVYGETIPTFRADSRVVVVKQPIGVTAAITPWNFPSAMITRKVSPALAVGCTAVIKPAPDTPFSAFALAVLAERAGIPAGVLNIITGDAPAIGQEMCSNPTVRFMGFTGSTAVGKLLMKQSADTVKRVGMELGGNAPFIVFDDADLDAAVEGLMMSKYRNSGQTCVCANRIYVQDGVFDAFSAKFVEAVSKLKVGPGIEEGTTQGPLINMAAVEKVEDHVKDAVAHGGKVLIGGKRHELGGTFFEPTVVTGATLDMKVSREETFGPLAPLYRFKDEDDVVKLANDVPAGLAAYFYSRDIGRVWRVAEELEYGMVGINVGILASSETPFGGVKESGIGREGSHHGVEEFLEMKYMLMSGI
ncbi:MAG: NAD-dependent succinate-semialdehyde dehydrogenase [Hyphomicrobiales bacterium]